MDSEIHVQLPHITPWGELVDPLADSLKVSAAAEGNTTQDDTVRRGVIGDATERIVSFFHAATATGTSQTLESESAREFIPTDVKTNYGVEYKMLRQTASPLLKAEDEIAVTDRASEKKSAAFRLGHAAKASGVATSPRRRCHELFSMNRRQRQKERCEDFQAAAAVGVETLTRQRLDTHATFAIDVHPHMSTSDLNNDSLQLQEYKTKPELGDRKKVATKSKTSRACGVEFRELRAALWRMEAVHAAAPSAPSGDEKDSIRMNSSKLGDYKKDRSRVPSEDRHIPRQLSGTRRCREAQQCWTAIDSAGWSDMQRQDDYLEREGEGGRRTDLVHGRTLDSVQYHAEEIPSNSGGEIELKSQSRNRCLIDREKSFSGEYMKEHHRTMFGKADAESESAIVSSEDDVEEPLGFFGVLRSQLILSSMLVFIPFGFCAYWLKWGQCAIFILNFLAIVPMAWLMGKCTEDISAHLGQITGGLVNAWFGNVVEMLLCFAGLRRGELVVVRSTLIGSILSNLLLVTGCSFLFGGMRHKVQEFSAIGASTNASLMTLSCMCLGLPTIYATILTSATASELQISRAVSFFLIFIYIQYLIFQLGTHSFLFADDDDEVADMSMTAAAIVLGLCSLLCSFCSDYLVSSIEGVVNTFNLSKEFIGIILLPIVGNAAEHYTSVIVAMRNKMDLSLACAVGSSCQMALFVTPFTVLVGWVFGQPMSLDLHAFELLVLVMAVLIITSILQDGYSHWLEGSMLVSAYCVISIIYFFEEPQFSEII